MYVVCTKKNKNNELLLLINLPSQRDKRIAWICDYMKIRLDLEWKQSICLKVHNIKKKQRFVKFLLFLHFIATGKFELLGILVLSRWRNIRIQAPHIQNPVRFRRFNIVKLPDPGASIYVQNKKIPHLGCPRDVQSLPHSGITLIAALKLDQWHNCCHDNARRASFCFFLDVQFRC